MLGKQEGRFFVLNILGVLSFPYQRIIFTFGWL